jgi:hypothetical protein
LRKKLTTCKKCAYLYGAVEEKGYCTFKAYAAGKEGKTMEFKIIKGE